MQGCLSENTKEVSLSEDGTVLYSYAKQMIDLEEQIEACFCGERQSDVRKITIAASTIPAQYILPGILARFIEKYPKEQFKVIETDSSKVIELISGGAADSRVFRNCSSRGSSANIFLSIRMN